MTSEGGGTPYTDEVDDLTIPEADGPGFEFEPFPIPKNAILGKEDPTPIGLKVVSKGKIKKINKVDYVISRFFHKGKPLGSQTKAEVTGPDWSAEHEFLDTEQNHEVTNIVTLVSIDPSTGAIRLFSGAYPNLKVVKMAK